MSDDSDRDAPAARPAPKRPRLNAAGEERPAFLLEFPDDPELEILIRAFEEGNFARVRKDAPALMKRTDDPRVRRAARELRERIDPDPLLIALLLLAFGLFAFLAAWIYSR